MPTSEIDSIDTALRLTQALNLARQGKLRDAQAVVAPGGAVPESALALHALAALTTGDGDHRRALQLWKLLQQRDPGSIEARRMIASIELWLARPAWFKLLPPALLVLGIGLLTGLLLLLW